MNPRRARRLLSGLVAAGALALWLAACQPAPTSAPPATQAPGATTVVEGEVSTAATPAGAVATQAPRPTEPPAATQPPAAQTPTRPAPTGTPAPAPSATLAPEARVVEVEWPPSMRLGDSDLVRLSLVPLGEGYAVQTEFEGHTTVTETVTVEPLAGYHLAAVARLDAAGFDVAPAAEVEQWLVPGQAANWRWTLRPLGAGQQRAALSLRLRWHPEAGEGPVREVSLYDRGLTINVTAFLGLTTREAATLGLAGLFFGSAFSLPLAAHLLRPRRPAPLSVVPPNSALRLEPRPGLALAAAEQDLLRALFRPYARLVLEAEFRSGYSGARTFLARPIHADGRADAYTIAKIGERGAIRQEYANFEAYVKDTLPPITARIQSPPVATGPALRLPGVGVEAGRAAVRYTFIGEPGRSPTSLREALLAEPDPALLEKLFATFGPSWWMQRAPYTFRLAKEYDRLLPTHYVVAPAPAGARPQAVLDGQTLTSSLAGALDPGAIVRLEHLHAVERRPDGDSLSLAGPPSPGEPPLRVRWLSLAPPEGAVGVVQATRASLLDEWTAGFELLPGLPDPLLTLPSLLGEPVTGTRSIIHGDLNLENVLVGPGGFVWLIDFAQTRPGHALFDFAYLEASLLAQVISPGVRDDAEFLRLLGHGAAPHPLLAALHAIAQRCLFNPAEPREYDLARYAACLGALKHTNLDAPARRRLFLAAAHLAQQL